MLGRLVTLIFLLLFNASVTASNAAEPTSERPSSFSDDKGLVALRIVTNTAAIDLAVGFSNKWGSLNVEHSDGTRAQLIAENDDGRRSTQIFAGLIPEGRYQITGLVAGQGGLGRSVSLKDQGMTFEVRREHITNLGTLIYQPIGNRETTVLRYPSTDDVQRFLRTNFSGLSELSAGRPVLGWLDVEQNTSGKVASGSVIVVSNSATMGIVGTITMGVMQAISDRAGATASIAEWHETTDAAARLSLAKQSTYALNNIQELPSGEIIAGTNLGQIVFLHPERGWKSVDIGDPREITAISATDADSIIIGGEEGLMLSSANGGRTWKAKTSPVPDGLIMHIGRHADELLVVTLYRNELLVHSQKDKEGAAWDELRRIPIAQPSLVINWPSLQGLAAIQNQKYLVMVPGGQVHTFDFESREWKSYPAPGWSREVRTQGADRVYTSQTSRAPHAFTTDGGATWTPYSNTCAGIYTWALSVAAVSRDELYMLCFGTGMFVGSTSLHKTSNGGNDWTELIKEMPVIASQMYATKNVVLYIDLTGSVYASKDAGSTWSKIKRTRM